MQRSSESIGAIAAALAKAQVELANPEKSLVATIRSPFPREGDRTFRYASLSSGLDLVRKAHAAQSLATLEQLQVEADHLVIAIVHQGEHEEFDETVRMSFAFALDQLRFAIAARRTAILDRADGLTDDATEPASGAAKPAGNAAAA